MVLRKLKEEKTVVPDDISQPKTKPVMYMSKKIEDQEHPELSFRAPVKNYDFR